MPDVYTTQLKYTDDISQTNISGSLTFNLNSVYDPYRTGVGGQPMGRDQLAGLYNRYKVLSCRYKINVYNSTKALKIAVAPINGSTEATTIEELEQQPYAKKRILSAVGGNDRTMLKGAISMKRIMGRSILDERDEATVSASPAEVAMLQFDYRSVDGASATFYLTVELVYRVQWFDRLLTAES